MQKLVFWMDTGRLMSVRTKTIQMLVDTYYGTGTTFPVPAPQTVADAVQGSAAATSFLNWLHLQIGFGVPEDAPLLPIALNADGSGSLITSVSGWDQTWSFNSASQLTSISGQDRSLTINYDPGTADMLSLKATQTVAQFGSGFFDQAQLYDASGSTISTSVLLDTGHGSVTEYSNFLDMDYSVKNLLFGSGLLSTSEFNSYNDAFSSWLLGSSPGSILLPDYYPSNLPIGAFYESRSPGNDPAPSIAADTPVLLNTAGQGMTEYGLTLLDANYDGMLTGTELTTLRAWVDANENGVAETGEIKTTADAGITEIREINYLYYAVGNAVTAPAAIATPDEAERRRHGLEG